MRSQIRNQQTTQLRSGLPRADILDVKKAYDCVPRSILQNTLATAPPSALHTALRPLLWPMVLKTKIQKSTAIVKTLVRMPQEDAPSPYLLNIFMHGYLRRSIPTRRET